jgi:phytoene dehydrogenase-like protein
MQPMLHLPRHPIRLTRFGIPALAPATTIARAFESEQAKAVFGGVAAHAISPLTKPLSASVGMALICSAHAFGWPVAKGGSRSITDALAAELVEHGGKIETGRRVESLDELPSGDVVLLDLSPARAADVAGSRLDPRVARAYRRYRHGPGAFKVDFAVEGGVPWTAEACRSAGTVHVTGTFDETVGAEAAVNAGRMPERPFVLVGQQYLADPSRSAGDVHPVWAYAHVPNGWERDETESLVGQIERFAPGFRERIVAQVSKGPAEFESYNANFIGGDIIGGANSPRQIVARPRLGLRPYSTGIPGVFMCSASTPPGAGVHGMNGSNAAKAALAGLG